MSSMMRRHHELQVGMSSIYIKCALKYTASHISLQLCWWTGTWEALVCPQRAKAVWCNGRGGDRQAWGVLPLFEFLPTHLFSTGSTVNAREPFSLWMISWRTSSTRSLTSTILMSYFHRIMVTIWDSLGWPLTRGNFTSLTSGKIRTYLPLLVC